MEGPLEQDNKDIPLKRAFHSEDCDGVKLIDPWLVYKEMKY